VSGKDERDYLMDQIAHLKADIESMEDRLAALDADKEGKAEA
jgi:ubiquinone biosynthesis protein UbiJ